MNAPEVPVRQGDILAGKYRVEKVLGIGGMGVVVAALHLELDQKVALKFLLPAAAGKPEVIARFSREARAAAKIRSEHVARVSDVGTLESGLPYIVMEYLDGGDLSDRLATKGPLSVSLAVDYLLQACEAVAEAHAAGIVHRDLKPGNLFLARQSDGSEIIKVLDFGISKSVIVGTSQSSSDDAKLTKTSDVFGSPMYMSPEQLKSARDVDARADLWALGAILFELLTGKAPFERGTIAEIFGAILHERAPLLRDRLSTAPEELSRVLDRCLEKEPAGRYDNVAQLAQALLPFGPTSSRPAVERAARVMRRAGVPVGSVPPPPDDDAPTSEPIPLRPTRSSELVNAAATTNLAVVPPAAAASTRTSWGKPESTPRPRSLRRPLVVGLLIGGLIAAASFVVVRGARLSPASPASSVIVEAPRPEPLPSASAAVPSATPSIEIAPALSSSVLVSAAPKLTGRMPHPAPTVAAVSTATPAVTVTSSRPAAPPHEDPDDFGGRQ
ncbi:MAG: protein kinase [Minicystis sp.]